MRAFTHWVRWGGMLCTSMALVACAHKKPPPQQTFHYRSAAHPLGVGQPFTARLDADSPSGYADAVKFHLEKTGTLILDARAERKVAVLVFGAGKKALVKTRSGATIDLPLIDGDVFVVVRALPGTGAVKVALASSFVAAPEGTKPARDPVVPVPGEVDDELATPDKSPADDAKGNNLSLDGL